MSVTDMTAAISAAFASQVEGSLKAWGATGENRERYAIEELINCDLPADVMRRAWVCLDGVRVSVTEIVQEGNDIVVRTRRCDAATPA